MFNEDPFVTLYKVGASLPTHALNILKQVGYTSFRGISQINAAKIRRIESYVQCTMSSNNDLADMTDEEKKKKVGPVHWKNPQNFVFLVGEEDEITAAANIAAKYVKELDENTHLSYPMGGKRRKLSKPVSSSTTDRRDPAATNSSTQIQTPKKKLTVYLSSWLINTCLTTNYTTEDYEVDEALNQVKCKHCPSVKMQIYIRFGMWKTNSFQNHVKVAHGDADACSNFIIISDFLGPVWSTFVINRFDLITKHA